MILTLLRGTIQFLKVSCGQKLKETAQLSQLLGILLGEKKKDSKKQKTNYFHLKDLGMEYDNKMAPHFKNNNNKTSNPEI